MLGLFVSVMHNPNRERVSLLGKRRCNRRCSCTYALLDHVRSSNYIRNAEDRMSAQWLIWPCSKSLFTYLLHLDQQHFDGDTFQ